MQADKKGAWTEGEDEFLLRWSHIGVDFVGPHDLGRSEKSSRDRLAKLVSSGAAENFARAWLAIARYRILVGRDRSRIVKDLLDEEAAMWERKAMEWSQ